MASPMPRLPPVTITLVIGTRQLPAGCYAELPDDNYAGWNLMRREICPAERGNFLCDSRIFTLRIGVQDDFRLDKRPRDRILARAHSGHSDPRMRVDDRLDLFGVHFHAADIDDAAASATKIISFAALL